MVSQREAMDNIAASGGSGRAVLARLPEALNDLRSAIRPRCTLPPGIETFEALCLTHLASSATALDVAPPDG